MTTNAMDPSTSADTRRLQRPREGRMVGGVALGLGRYFDVDPVIFRIVFAVLAVFGGAGLVLYAAGWLLMPEEGSPASHLDDFVARHRRPGRRSWAVIVIVAALLIWGIGALAHAHPGGLVGGAVLIGLAFLIAREHNRNRLATPATRVASADAAPAGAAVDAGVDPTTATTAAYPAQPYEPSPPRPRSALGLLTVSAALVAVGIMTALGVSGAADPQPADVVAVALGIVGLGLVVGAVVGRAWLLIPLGLLLVLGLGVARAIPPDVPWTSGDRVWMPTAGDVHNRYALGVGDARLDLTKLDLATSHDVSVRLGAGRIVVVVPPGATVDVRARASAGHLQLLGAERNGTGLDEHQVLAPASGPSSGTVTLDLRVGFGDVEVDRAAA
jgi:phage shock protein PspC (stress-responsive transcriptional regulator)